MDWRVAFLFVLLVSAGCLGTVDETPSQEEKTPPYGENVTIAEIVEGHDENEVQGYRYTLSVRDTETGELRRESVVKIDYADRKMFVEENDIGENVTRTTYANLSSDIRYYRKLEGSTYSERQPVEMDADKMIEQHSVTGIFSPLPANETRLILEDNDEKSVFRYSTGSVTAGGIEATDMSVSLTAEGFIQGFSFTSEGLEYIAEVERRDDIDVETPDWADTDETAESFRSFFGAVAVEQESEDIRFVIISPAALDKVRLDGPGGTSVSHEDLVQAGMNIMVRDGGFSEEEVDRKFMTPNDDECVIKHAKTEVAGQTVASADIPCDGSGIDGLEGDDIRYETGAEYQIVGVVDGEEAVIETVTTEQE
jgi:hypothetical protein